ncbi:MAG: WD40/YVTN/BNR-like repeat-containing protein [Gammaproteobacteria bacterium]
MDCSIPVHKGRTAGACLLVLAGMLLLACGAQAKPNSPGFTKAFQFRNIGPAVAGGRVTSVVGIPGNPSIYYVGTAGGGVWKSTDGGNSWNRLLTDADTSSIGAVALAPSNLNDVWVGTGEANVRNDTLTGGGVYYSPDAGKTWQFMGLKDVGQIAAIVVNPQNPNIVLVAALGDPWGPNEDRGVFRTTDGGKTWQKVLYVDDKTGASDLVMDSANPNVLFAGMWSVLRYPWTLVDGSKTGGVWKSTDNGATWKQLKNGLPDGNTGRISLAIAPSNPNHVYALIPTRNGMLWASEDQGASWQMISNNHALATRAWYFAGMAVAPNDENRVFFNSVHLMVSNDGGKTAQVADSDVHPDHHAIWIDPQNPKRIVQGNDGGVFLSNDAGKSWRFLDSLPIEQAYTVSLDAQSPFHACLGLQDNSAWCGPTSTLDQDGVTGKNWMPVVGGDGEYSVLAPSDPNVVYSDLEDGYTVRYDFRTHLSRQIRPSASYGLQNTDKSLAKSKYRFNWTSPIAVSPNDADTVYLGANVLFKSTDGGAAWSVISPDLTRNDKSKQQVPGGPIFHDISSAEDYDTLLSISLAPTAPNQVIWVGSDDGLVHVTRDGGKTWQNVTPPAAPKWSRVYQIGVSPFDAGAAYLSFDAHMLDDDRAYVYKTTDYGRSWTSIAKGLLAHTPVLVVREDPSRKGLLVAGTMTGLYYSLDDGGHWQPLAANLPTTAVFDLKFAPHADSLAVATHGDGLYVLDNLRPLEEWNDAIAKDDFHLFSAKPGILYNHWMGGGSQQASYMAPNAPEGVVFSYFLKAPLKGGTPDKGPVKIVITRNGQTINTLYGAGKAGLNEVVWDTDYAGPTPLGSGHQEPGPDVLPGTYTAAFTSGAQTASQPAAVSLDPNLHVDLSDYEAQLRVALQYTAMMSATDEMLNRLNDWSKQLDSVQTTIQGSDDTSKYKDVSDQAKQLQKKITTLKDVLLQPDVQHDVDEDFLHTLPRMHGMLMWNQFLLGGYGQRPGQPMIAKTDELSAALNGYIASFNDLVSKAVPTFNAAAYLAGIGTLAPGKPAELKVVVPAPAVATGPS